VRVAVAAAAEAPCNSIRCRRFASTTWFTSARTSHPLDGVARSQSSAPTRRSRLANSAVASENSASSSITAAASAARP
jgi:hypothetical protein